MAARGVVRAGRPAGLQTKKGTFRGMGQQLHAEKQRHGPDASGTRSEQRGSIFRGSPLGANRRNRAQQQEDAIESLARRLPALAPVTSAVTTRDMIYRRSLAVADVLATLLTILIARAIVGSRDLDLLTLAVAPMIVVIAKVIGIYDSQASVVSRSTLDEAPVLFQLATACAVAIWLVNSLITGRSSSQQLLVELIALFALLFVLRATARAICRRVTPPERCLVIGSGGSADRIRVKLEQRPELHANLVGYISLDDYQVQDARDTVERARALRALVADFDVERIVLAPATEDADEVLDLVRTASSLGVKVTVVPRVLGVVGSSVEFDEVEGMPLLSMRTASLSRSSLRIKRGLDIGLSIGGLVALSPLLLLIAIAIRIESRGSILFRQPRIGRDGDEFEMLKFRTMVSGAHEQRDDLRHLNEAEGLFKISDDPRITRVGAILRRCSIDELPQLWNVIRGDMSLVGPRPLLAEEDRHILGWHRRRLQIPPGITGHWQILGSSRIPLREMVDIDYLYVTNWSLWNDVKIMLRTVPYVVARRGL
jgi:exopolysaccharide biosynthesis polyprenyl glycosylphosphotransferase